MKKLLSAILAVIMLAAAFTATASAAENSNHYIEPDYPSLNKKETAWEIYGWTVVDTEIVKIGYILDEGETVWAVPEVDARDDNSRIEENDAFRDFELEAAIIEYSLQNGLEEFFAYRIYLTIDTTELAKGKHIVEVIAEYADNSEDNPFRGEIFSFNKKKGTASSAATEAAAGPATEPATAPATEPATEKATEKATEPAAQQTEPANETNGPEKTAEPVQSEAQTEKSAGETKNNVLPTILIIAAAVVALAVGGFFILKKKK